MKKMKAILFRQSCMITFATCMLMGCSAPDVEPNKALVENDSSKSEVKEPQNTQLQEIDSAPKSIAETSLGTWCKSGIYLEILEVSNGEYVKRIKTGKRAFDEPLRKSSDGQFHLNNSAKTFYAIRPNALEVRTRHGFDGVLLPPSEESTDTSCVPMQR